MNGNRSYAGASGKISAIDGPIDFLKIDTEDDKTRCAGSLN